MPWNGMPAGMPVRPRIEDVELIATRVENLQSVTGEMRSWRTAYTNGKRTVNGRLTGANLVYGDMRNHIARAGG